MSYRWVEPAGGLVEKEAAGGGPWRGRWRLWGALVVVVVVVAAVGVVGWRSSDGSGDEVAAGVAEPRIGTSTDQLIGFSLARVPVSAWQLTAADIGLPAQASVGRMFAAIGNKAYFVTTTGCEGECVAPKGWVYGLDGATGERLFDPVELDGFWNDANDCHSNGPTEAVCLNLDECIGECGEKDRWGWVIDLERGQVSFAGEPGVYAGIPGRQDKPNVVAIGNNLGETWLVGTIEGKGVYGVGDQLEPTWFLPGSGTVFPSFLGTPVERETVTVATQSRDRATGQMAQVFSVEGQDLTPTPPQGFGVGNVQEYPGGFAVEFTHDHRSAGVSLFDTEGVEVANFPDGRSLETSDAMPVFEVGGRKQVFTATGDAVAEVSGFLDFRSIGTRLYQQVDIYEWDWVDLLTGQRGPACRMEFNLGYAGSDGNVILWRDSTFSRSDSAYVAVDSTTCRVLWETPDHQGTPEALQLHRVGSNLLQIDSETVTGLRAPE